VRLLAVAFGAVALAAGATAAAPRVHLPRDHFGHDAGIEWWYVTADVRGGDGARYSVFFTLFKRGGLVLPVSQVVNLSTGAIVAHSERLVPARIGSTGLRFESSVAELVYEQASNIWAAAAKSAGYALRFRAHPEKPYVLHGGGTGMIRQGPKSSAYYSATRMSVRGNLVAGGRSTAFAGTGWLDHQWGNFAADQRARSWDWFSCRFDDRTELMLYSFRDGHRNGTYVDRQGRGRRVGGFESAAGARALRAAGKEWPLDWTVRVSSPRLSLSLHSLAPDQLVRGTVLPTFWEGASAVSGSKHGTCFVEETS